MELTFHGSAGTVTGACYQLRSDKKNILIDCGMYQGKKEFEKLNYQPFRFNPAEIDAVVLTHAHIDHTGLLPKLSKEGFRGKVYCTPPTKELAKIMLPDAAYIQEMEVERKNRKALRSNKELLEPIYTLDDAERVLQSFIGVDYGKEIHINNEFKVIFRDAGHILGSSIVEIYFNNKKIVFSGDLGRHNQPLIKDPEYIKDTDYLVMESTYGSRFHIQTESKKDQFARIVKKTIRKGGNVVIPSFAVERTQEVIYILKTLMDNGEIPKLDIYLDSPLAIKATEIFSKYPCGYDEIALEMLSKEEDNDLFKFENLKFSLTAEESQKLNSIRKNAIIISASGMAEAGRIKHHLKHNLWRPESTIVFVGYQAEGTLGRRILDGSSTVRIHGEEISVKAEIELIEGFSGHADQKDLMNWINNFDEIRESIFLVHGDDDARESMKNIIEENTNYKVILPNLFEIIDLTNFEIRYQGEIVKADKKLAEMLESFNANLNDYLKDPEKVKIVNDYLKELKDKLVG